MNHSADDSIPCHACEKPIKFIQTKNGRMMPVDAELKVAKEDSGLGTFFLVSGAVQKGITAGQCYYIPHWSTCTNPAAFRRRK